MAKVFKTTLKMKDTGEDQILAHSSKTNSNFKTQEENEIICNHCGHRFQDKQILRMHILDIIRRQEMIKKYTKQKKIKKDNNEIQKEIKPFHCAYCGSLFKYKDSLKKHILKHKCKHCDQHFQNKEELKNHSKIHITIEPTTSDNTQISPEESECNICKQRMFTSFDLKIHRLKAHNECSICKILFPEVEILKDHITNHKDDKESSDEMLKILNLTITLDDGILNKRIFSCHICNKHFQLPNSLDDHIADHHNQINSFTCTYCKKVFTNEEKFNTHIEAHTNPNISQNNTEMKNEKTHLCLICLKKFSDKNRLQQHNLIHTSGKSFLCDICCRLFTSSESLDNHKKTTHNENK